MFDTLRPDWYYINVKDANGCTASNGSYQLLSDPAPQVTTAGGGKYCEGDTIRLRASASRPSLLYKWQFKSQDLVNMDYLVLPHASVNDSGTYKVIVMDSLSGCKNEDSVYVKVNPLPIVDFGLKPTICAGNQIVLSPGSGYAKYLWQDGSRDSSFRAVDEGVYYVIVTDTSHCKSSDTIELVHCSQVYMPTAFSPNGDTHNDTFKPVVGNNVLLDYLMVVYSRWGQIVYESNDYSTGWDGKCKGEELPIGAYSYIVTFRMADHINQGAYNKSKLRGMVILVR